jgi:hypothetical protein
MARQAKRTQEQLMTNRRGYWSDEIAKAEKRYGVFHRTGNNVQDRYRLERENSEADLYQDRYNILYSSTETTRPSLYAQTPKVQATKRHRDRENEYVTLATLLMEAAGQYALEEVDFDGVMKNVVQDFLLPGLGQAWVRYDPKIKSTPGANDNEAATEELVGEGIDLDYVHYKDFITGVGRVWKELPWIARRVYFDKEKATARFGAEKAQKLAYSYRPSDDGNGNRDFAGHGGYQAVIWEIWDKRNRKVIWYSVDLADDVLEEIPDPLKLKNFWPCPEPVRAVWTTRTFIPKSFYSQYKAQAEELDNITERIRHLTQALRLVGVYDGSQTQLAQLLTGKGNKLVPVENWTMFAQQGGIAGSIMYVPIKEVAEVLMNLLQQREVVKAEIYEITGFSDIVRGVSKASETLGAQKIKSDWAGGRLRDMQKEIQRFCRDLIRIITEIMSEHFSEESLALYAGFDPPEVTPEEQAAVAQYAVAMQQYQAALAGPVAPGTPQPQPPQKPGPTAQQQAIQTFSRTVKLLKTEKERAASIGIETDSTIMPDEAAEREDRMTFLSSAGAFLQQAGPMALQFPDMRALLGAVLMFTIRTFRSSRPLEKAFEDFQKKLEAAPPQNPDGEGGDNGQAAAQAQIQVEQIKQQGAQALAQTTAAADAQAQQAQAAADNEAKKYEVDAKMQLEREKMQSAERIKMAELALREREVAVKEAELGIKREEVQVDAALADQQQQHDQQMDREGLVRQDEQFDASREDADRNIEQQEADRAAAAKKPNKPA